MSLDEVLCAYNEGTPLTANTTGTGRVALSSLNGPSGIVTVYNPTEVTVRVRFGASGVTSTAACFPLPPGEMQPFNALNATHVAAWCASGTAGIELFAGGGL